MARAVPRILRAVSIVLLLVWMLPAAAQDQQNQSQDDQEQAPTFKVDVNVVNLYFNVKDKHGALIPDLKKEDFQVS
ncbi:MAG TPA: VWA domain-containing protein, partial [Terriglobales bacterium]